MVVLCFKSFVFLMPRPPPPCNTWACAPINKLDSRATNSALSEESHSNEIYPPPTPLQQMHSWNVSSRCSCKAFQLLSISPHPPQWNEPFPWVYSTWWSNQTWGLNSFAQIWHALCHSPNPYSSIYLFFWMEIQISTLHSDIQATCHALLWYAFLLCFLT